MLEMLAWVVSHPLTLCVLILASDKISSDFIGGFVSWLFFMALWIAASFGYTNWIHSEGMEKSLFAAVLLNNQLRLEENEWNGYIEKIVCKLNYSNGRTICGVNMDSVPDNVSPNSVPSITYGYLSPAIQQQVSRINYLEWFRTPKVAISFSQIKVNSAKSDGRQWDPNYPGIFTSLGAVAVVASSDKRHRFVVVGLQALERAISGTVVRSPVVPDPDLLVRSSGIATCTSVWRRVDPVDNDNTVDASYRGEVHVPFLPACDVEVIVQDADPWGFDSMGQFEITHRNLQLALNYHAAHKGRAYRLNVESQTDGAVRFVDIRVRRVELPTLPFNAPVQE